MQKSHPQRVIVNRFGISVSKKVGTAVKRNRAKRVIRAAYAPLEDKLYKGFLIVVSAKPDIAGAKSTDVQNEMRYAFKRLEMLDGGAQSK